MGFQVIPDVRMTHVDMGQMSIPLKAVWNQQWYLWVSIAMGVPKHILDVENFMVYIHKDPMKIDDLGVPFEKTSRFGWPSIWINQQKTSLQAHQWIMVTGNHPKITQNYLPKSMGFSHKTRAWPAQLIPCDPGGFWRNWLRMSRSTAPSWTTLRQRLVRFADGHPED